MLPLWWSVLTQLLQGCMMPGHQNLSSFDSHLGLPLTVTYHSSFELFLETPGDGDELFSIDMAI